MVSEHPSTAHFPTPGWLEGLLASVNQDSEAAQKIRGLKGRILFEIGDTQHLLHVDGRHFLLIGTPDMHDSWDLAVRAPQDRWRRLFSPVPVPGSQSFTALRVMDPDFRMEGNQLFAAQILPLLERLAQLARDLNHTSSSEPLSTVGATQVKTAVDRDPSQITGHYIDLSGPTGNPSRVYYEEAGEGIPLVLLHTAGSDSRQFHELLCDTELAANWRMLAFDLPYHGRSMPPDGWWKAPYRLSARDYAHWCLTFIRKVVCARAVVMGCSMGGAMAVYLASRHRSDVSAAIALEAPDISPGRLNPFLNNPQVNQASYAPNYVFGLMSPLSPEEHRRRAWWHYSQGGFGVYEGDLTYYSLEWDGRQIASEIDTRECPVYLLTGDYDYSASPESSRRLAELIPGVRLQIMAGLGHFPMTENPDVFRSYLLPVLEELKSMRETKV